MSDLEIWLKDVIALEGPISVERFMGLCLGHPLHGYYMTRDPFGRAGDFITAPDISQMFGELLGLWCADIWLRLGQPAPFRLIELGPGRGVLMADALRAMRVAPGLPEAAEIHLVETSPVLRERQRAALEPSLAPIAWHESASDIPAGPSVVVANEFFDALPIRQFIRRADGWHERLVGLAADGRLIFGLAPEPTGLALPHDAPNGSIRELAPSAARIMGDLVKRLRQYGGAALIVDYGYTVGAGDTLQAVRAHQRVNPLSAPGHTDLTAHVDFAALAAVAEKAGLTVFGPTPQGAFLRALGIERRAAALSAAASPAARADITAALERLTGEAAMGTLFKVLAIASPGLAVSGFDPDAGSQAGSAV